MSNLFCEQPSMGLCKVKVVLKQPRTCLFPILGYVISY